MEKSSPRRCPDTTGGPWWTHRCGSPPQVDFEFYRFSLSVGSLMLDDLFLGPQGGGRNNFDGQTTWWWTTHESQVAYNPGYFHGIFVVASRPLITIGWTNPQTRSVGWSTNSKGPKNPRIKFVGNSLGKRDLWSLHMSEACGKFGWNRIVFWLVVWLPSMNYFPRNIGNVIIPIDELIFFRGVQTTNQLFFQWKDGDRIKEDFPNENCVKLQNWAPYCPGPTEADIFGWKTLKRKEWLHLQEQREVSNLPELVKFKVDRFRWRERERFFKHCPIICLHSVRIDKLILG